jgi:hypothetical protein
VDTRDISVSQSSNFISGEKMAFDRPQTGPTAILDIVIKLKNGVILFFE